MSAMTSAVSRYLELCSIEAKDVGGIATLSEEEAEAVQGELDHLWAAMTPMEHTLVREILARTYVEVTA